MTCNVPDLTAVMTSPCSSSAQDLDRIMYAQAYAGTYTPLDRPKLRKLNVGDFLVMCKMKLYREGNGLRALPVAPYSCGVAHPSPLISRRWSEKV